MINPHPGDIKTPSTGVIFDLDGTLVDSLGDIADAINSLLVQEGYPAHSLKDYYGWVGHCHEMKQFIGKAFAPFEQISSRRQDQLLERFKSVHESNWCNRSRPFPGVRNLLYQLERRAIPSAVLSNKLHEFTVKTVAHFLPGNKFVRIRGARPGISMKPDPNVALSMAAHMRLAPHEIAFVGDSRDDMQTAVRAGMTAVGVAWGYATRDDLWRSGARLIIEEPMELLTHFMAGGE